MRHQTKEKRNPLSLRTWTSSRIRNVLFWRILPSIYQQASGQQAGGLRSILFLEQKEDSLGSSFQYLWDYLDAHYDLNLQFFSLEQGRVSNAQFIKNNIEAARLIASASHVFLNDASDLVSCLPLRPETKVTQLWHGCGAFKKWGASTSDLKFGGTRESYTAHPFYKNLSLVTVSSPEVRWAYIEAMMLEDEPQIVEAIGVSNTDVYFDPAFTLQARNSVASALPEIAGRKIILFAPTYRGTVKNAQPPRHLDVSSMAQRLSDEYALVIKHHPFVKDYPAIPDDARSFAFNAESDIPTADLLGAADICLLDYSSLVFEYSLLDRPMIFFAPDLDDYNDWRGFYYDYSEITPGPLCTTNEQLISCIERIDQTFDAQQVAAFRKRFMSACDGHATERICERLFGPAVR